MKFRHIRSFNFKNTYNSYRCLHLNEIGRFIEKSKLAANKRWTFMFNKASCIIMKNYSKY